MARGIQSLVFLDLALALGVAIQVLGGHYWRMPAGRLAAAGVGALAVGITLYWLTRRVR